MNISGAGLSGLYDRGMRSVEPVMKTGQQADKGQESEQESQQEPQQEPQREQPSFGWLLEEEFKDSLASGVCPNCGNPVYQNPRGRRKKFCSEACRFEWKNRHPKPENWSSSRLAVCPVCGKEFIASREYGKKRKYCSRSCSNTGRAAEKRMTIKEEKDGQQEQK